MAPMRRTLLLAVSTLAAGCEIKDDENPTITIVAPADGARNDSSSVQVTVDVDRFTLDPTVYPIDDGSNSEPFKGHWHLYLDRFFVDDEFTDSALLTNVEPGVHELAAELVNQNHQYIHGTPVSFSFVEIPTDAPRIVITNPDDGGTVQSSSVELTVEIENLVLDTNLGGANASGHGHYHVAVDGGPAMEAIGTTVTLSDLAPTTPVTSVEPVITVELVRNDHSSFTTPVLDQSRVTIPSSATRIAIGAPIEGATVGTALDLTFTLANFQLVDFATAVAESSGQGHYHLLVDGVQVADDYVTPPLSIPLLPGDHELRLELRSNQHDPPTPPVVDVVHITAE